MNLCHPCIGTPVLREMGLFSTNPRCGYPWVSIVAPCPLTSHKEELPEAASGGANTPPEAVEKEDFPGEWPELPRTLVVFLKFLTLLADDANWYFGTIIYFLTLHGMKMWSNICNTWKIQFDPNLGSPQLSPDSWLHPDSFLGVLLFGGPKIWSLLGSGWSWIACRIAWRRSTIIVFTISMKLP